MRIKGSVALVTGANRGLGRAYTAALLAGGAAKVYAACRDPANAVLPGCVPLQLDITKPDDVAAAAAAAGDVNVLINNAGILQSKPFLSDIPLPTIQAHFDTNFFGTLAMSRAFAPILASNGGGALVNVLSVLSWMSLPAAGPYCASKAAEWALTNGLRFEMRAQGTQVIGVHAAFIDTDMAKNVQLPKNKPEDVARMTLEALEAGMEEVLIDDITRKVKSEFNAATPIYLKEWGR